MVDIHPVDKPQELSIIILLGDGMGTAQLTAAWYEQQGLALDAFPYTALVRTHATDKFVTESGAANTAMMCGRKTKYGYIGIDPQQQPMLSLYEQLMQQGYQTGIITSSTLCDASPAVLYSHRNNRYAYEDITLDFYNQPPHIAYGGGRQYFTQRTDQLQLLDSLQKKGYHLYDECAQMAGDTALPMLCVPYDKYPPMLLDGRPKDMEIVCQKALECLQAPFFLFVEGGLIDHGGHNTNIAQQISETLEFDRLCGYALNYAKAHENVLVLVVSDHECGGLSLLQDPSNAMGYIPHYAVDEHSGNMVPLFAAGSGAHLFTGLMDNTDIYLKIMSLLHKK